MNSRIQVLTDELVKVVSGHSPKTFYEHLCKVLPGVEDGTFFSRSSQDQIAGLSWLNSAYFGKGELANPLLDDGFLPETFPLEFNKEVIAYVGHLRDGIT